MDSKAKFPRVSMFAGAFGKVPEDADLERVLSDIRSDRWRVDIEAVRATYSKTLAETGDAKKAKAAVADAKKRLPAFLVSGTATSRTEPLQHSGLLQIDLDGLNSNLESVRTKAKEDPHVAFGFVSPSGDGLKLGLAIDAERHLESFAAAECYFRDVYGLEIDPAVKDRLRLCFVSHDPAAWLNEALPLPLSQVDSLKKSVAKNDKAAAGDSKNVEPEFTVLPSGDVSISESAAVIFRKLAPSRSLFWRGGALVELVTADGATGLDVLRPEKFRSDVEKFGRLFAWRSGRKGKAVLSPAKMSLDDAKAILASSEAREHLPAVASVLRCPVLVASGESEVTVLGQGYHAELGGLLIVAGDPPPPVPLAEAVAGLRWLVDEFAFQDEGDRSRALAAFLAPALRLGGHLRGHIPMDVAEADKSQAGKGHRLEMVATLYNERGYYVTAKRGGVGSVDESFQAALVAARPFICLDNFRGRMDSQNLEAFLTCTSLFPCRIPHRGEVLVDPRRFLLQLSSNGLDTTRDLANRASICRIRKRPGFAYRDTLGELQRRQPYFLGCVFAVIVEWLSCGRPRTTDTRHDFREWSQSLDWIVQKTLGCAPLMDGHQAAQERTSNPALTWLRAVALAVDGEGRLGAALIASELVEVCEMHAIEIPGRPADDDRAKRQVGSLCKQLFRDGETVAVDGYLVERGVRFQQRDNGGQVDLKTYTFSKP